MKNLRDPRTLRGYRRLELGEEGQAMIEFILTFPWVMLIALCCVQLSLMYATQNVVDYAAFCAARSASVFAGRYNSIPFINGRPNELDDGKLYGRIHIAAAMPLTVVSPSLTQVGSRLPVVGPGAAFVAQIIGLVPSSLRGIINQVDKFAYAYAATSILPGEGGVSISTEANVDNWGSTFLNEPVDDPADRGNLFVKVSYIKYLEIPFAGYLIAQYIPLLTGHPINRATAAYGDKNVNFWPIMGYCRVPNEGSSASEDQEPNITLDVWGIF